MKKVFETFAFVVALITTSTLAPTQNVSQCGTCSIPCARSQDTLFLVQLKGSLVHPSQQFVSINRDTAFIAGETVQAYRLVWMESGQCWDTVVQSSQVNALVMGSSLGLVPPLYKRIFPAREFVLNKEPTSITSWAEVGVFAAYAGPDESQEAPSQIGIETLYYGADVLVAPFGDMLGNNLSLALGAGLTLEGGRLRVPAVAHLRYTFKGSTTITQARYMPDSCTFMCDSTADTIVVGDEYVQRSGTDEFDPTVVLLRERVRIADSFTPYLFVEGGWVFDTGFEGSGATPSENAEEYYQPLAGIGGGIPITENIHVQLAYRYMRLNLRTPCLNCEEIFQVNTNSVHSALLRFVYHLGW